MKSLNMMGKRKWGMRFGRLSLFVLSATVYQCSSGVDQVSEVEEVSEIAQAYEQVTWPMQATTIVGTPSPWYFGEVVAAATTQDGNLLVFHRGAHPIMEFDLEGRFLRSWGDGLISEGKVTRVETQDRGPDASGYTAVYGPPGCYSCGAHSIRVDQKGYIWVVDATAHVVYKMNSQGHIIQQFGTKGVPGTDSSHFNLPTDVAFSPNGEIYISDGYASARVAKFTAEGEYILQWGKRGNGPGEFELPHNLVIDAQGRVYVTDRDNQRIQIFDSEGKFLDQWEGVGGVSTLFMTKDQQIWTGGVLRNLEGEILARLPGNPGGHGTSVTESGDVFIAQLSGAMQKFVKH